MHPAAKGQWERLEKVPLLPPTLAFVAGTLAASGMRGVPCAAFLLAVTFLAILAWAAYLLRSDRSAFVLLSLAFLAGGSLWNQAAFQSHHQELARLQPALENGVSPEWSGVLYRDPQVFADRTVLHVQLRSCSFQENTVATKAKARITVFSPDGAAVRFSFGELFYGDALRIRGSLAVPRNFRNPGMFDYAASLSREGILLTGSLKSPLLVDLVVRQAGDPLLAACYSVRRTFRNYLSREFSADAGGADSSAILEALLFGQRSNLNPRIEKLFQETGTYHVFVVSGFNTTIIAVFLVWLFRKLRLPGVAVVIATGAALAVYALMTELGPSVVRASILSFIVLLAQALYRRGSPVNSLALAAMATLLCWPEMAWEPGFQLTYLACLAILLVGVPAVGRLLDPFHYALNHLFGQTPLLLKRDRVSRLARRLRFGLELWAERAADVTGGRARIRQAVAGLGRVAGAVGYYVAGLLLISAAVQMAMAPLMAYMFNRANVSSFVANLFVVPLMTALLLVTLFLGGTLCILGWTWKPWVAVSGWVLEHLLGGLEAMARSGLWHWRVPTPPLSWVFLYLALLTAAVLPLRRALRLTAAAAVALLFPTFWWNPFPMQRQAPGGLETYFLDVGQGDSIFLIFPDNSTLLVDAGGTVGAGYSEETLPAEGLEASRFDIGEDVVSRFLWRLRVRVVDQLALTHPHMDHAGGMTAIVGNFPVKELLGPVPVEKLAETLPWLTEAAAARGLRWRGLQRGDARMIGSSRIAVLNPPQSQLGAFAQPNNRSLVLHVHAAGHSLMLPGDIEKFAEWDLSEDCDALRAEVLKVAHHGSLTSTTENFLQCVDPRWAVISVGWNSRFSHPSPQVLERFKSRGIRVFQTSLEGAVYAAFTPGGVVVAPATSPEP